ncbi:MAG: L,D-transpeptidase family protein [Shimia sp.]
MIRAIALLALVVLAGCASKFRTYDGPEVTQINVFKEQRLMRLMHHQEVLEEYRFELGFAPTGHKEQRGDGRTPEGVYYIDRKNPNSKFYLSIGISYPNANDRAHAAALGVNPGGDIFIHGTPRKFRGDDDWTMGCLAVTDKQMRDIYAMVNVGTPIVILP